MKKSLFCIFFSFICLGVFALVGNANGELIDLGDITQDTDTGLEWLDMNYSSGVSALAIIKGFDPNQLASQGWKHASLEQIRNLFLNAGMTETFDGSQSPWNFEGADLIINLLGATGSFGNSVSIQSFSGEGTEKPYLYTPVVITSFGTVGGADFPGVLVPVFVANPSIGSWLVRPSASAEEVPVDIKPGSCPNPLNVKSKGVLPVAIISTESFDATMVDPVSVRLEGVAPLRCAYADVGFPFEPFVGKEDCSLDCEVSNPDGFEDLVLKFNRQEIIAALGDVEDGECWALKLTGNLFDGLPIVGEDMVIILNKGK